MRADAIRATTLSGALPLLTVLSLERAAYLTVEMLLAAHAESVAARNKSDGRTTLHIACGAALDLWHMNDEQEDFSKFRRGVNPALVRLLCRTDSEAARAAARHPSARGRLPLHYLASHVSVCRRRLAYTDAAHSPPPRTLMRRRRRALARPSRLKRCSP